MVKSLFKDSKICLSDQLKSLSESLINSTTLVKKLLSRSADYDRHLRAHETDSYFVFRLLLEKKNVATSQATFHNQHESQLRHENAHNDKSVHGVVN
ncbi:hypothetical protein FWI74_05905, partial [Francisella tularensis subsp. holarctica]|nr:hypothetical protein [Francisella tularensis subsp. holarctica]